MSRHLLLGFLFLPLLGLAQQRPAVHQAKPKLTTKLSPQKTLTITTPCAVLYEPDATWIARYKKRDSTAFYTVADDAMYYTYQTREYLGKRKIKTVDTQASTLRFILANGSVKAVDLHKSTHGWGLILFNGRNAPKEADLVEPEADVKAVFGR